MSARAESSQPLVWIKFGMNLAQRHKSILQVEKKALWLIVTEICEDTTCS